MYATQIRERRITLGYTQTHLADLAGVDVKTVQRAESGARFSAETLLALCSALKTDPATLAEAAAQDERIEELVVIGQAAEGDPALIADLRHSLADLHSVTYLVIPCDAMSKAPPASPLPPLFGGIGLGMCGMSVGVALASTAKLFGITPHPAMVAIGALAFILSAPWFLRPKEANAAESRIDRRAYALGREQVAIMTITADAVARQVHRIDPRRPVERFETADRVTYVLPIEGGRVGLYDLPVDPRIDALLMRNRDRWGYREIPRLSTTPLAAA
jgi:transcriptional regulator with XRE-family HTH domain